MADSRKNEGKQTARNRPDQRDAPSGGAEGGSGEGMTPAIHGGGKSVSEATAPTAPAGATHGMDVTGGGPGGTGDTPSIDIGGTVPNPHIDSTGTPGVSGHTENFDLDSGSTSTDVADQNGVLGGMGAADISPGKLRPRPVRPARPKESDDERGDTR